MAKRYSTLVYISHIPDSIFVNICLAHLRKVSSTFSPVRALVSRNINSTKVRTIIQKPFSYTGLKLMYNDKIPLHMTQE